MIDRFDVESRERDATDEGEQVAQIIPPKVGLGQQTGQDAQNDREQGQADEHRKDGNDGVVLPDRLVAEERGDVLGGFGRGLAFAGLA